MTNIAPSPSQNCTTPYPIRQHETNCFFRESCKKLESHWSAVQEKEQSFTVDCSAEPDYCLEQKVYSHPAIRAYFPGGYKRYRGPREADECVPSPLLYESFP